MSNAHYFLISCQICCCISEITSARCIHLHQFTFSLLSKDIILAFICIKLHSVYFQRILFQCNNLHSVYFYKIHSFVSSYIQSTFKGYSSLSIYIQSTSKGWHSFHSLYFYMIIVSIYTQSTFKRYPFICNYQITTNTNL